MREYLYVHCPNTLCPYWYGFLENGILTWSDWYDTFEDAIECTIPIQEHWKTLTIEKYIENNPNLVITRLPGPISRITHPEYFI